MTDAVFHPATLASGAFLRCVRFAALVGHSLSRAVLADETRPALDELPDNLLKDLGVARNEIPFAAARLSAADEDPARGARDCLTRCVAERDTATRLSHVALRLL
jgi:uncharacterized protein YjiS (DUF1127 family)